MTVQAKIGCDIVAISRIAKMMTNPELLKKVFTVGEMKRPTAEHLAGIFAVKEAGFKALELSNTPWLSFEVKYKESGKPTLHISRDLLAEPQSVDCSISHDGRMAMATVIILL